MELLDYFRKRNSKKFINQLMDRLMPGLEEDLNDIQDYYEKKIFAITDNTYNSIARSLIDAKVVTDEALKRSLPLKCEIISFVLFETIICLHSATSENFLAEYSPLAFRNTKIDWTNRISKEFHLKRRKSEEFLQLVDNRIGFYHGDMKQYYDEQKSGKGISKHSCKTFTRCFEYNSDDENSDANQTELICQIEQTLENMLKEIEALCNI